MASMAKFKCLKILPSILLAQHKQGISGLYSRSSFNHSGKFLYVTFLVVSKT